MTLQFDKYRQALIEFARVRNKRVDVDPLTRY